ncbi:MAG TPA: alanine racemase [Nocardioidaceae bacterium]|nr:alanine racemase [Nocardioidaceae bacterium]
MTPVDPAEVETPALVVDLDRLSANVTRMSDTVRSRGLSLRPHAKTHKCLEIARMQVDAGAAGLTVATLSEAEIFASAGFGDLFVAYPVYPVGAKAGRLRDLLSRVDLCVGVDNAAGASALAEAAGGRPLRVVLEVDSGQHRTGVDPGAVVALAEDCRALGLSVTGVFTHGGHSYGGPDAPPDAAADEGAALGDAAARLTAAGFEVSVVSAGATPTTGAARPEVVTEERPGSYVFYDRQQLSLGACSADDLALTVATTVVSTGHGRFVVDAGSKALASDRPAWLHGHGWVPSLGEAYVTTLSEHHGIVEGASRTPAVGEVVQVVPNHVCTVVNLFDDYVVVRGDTVVDRWRIAARGRNT